ncbi:MAG: DNA polymerase I, partial [Clostridia bacterium]|nr:DNA polymerase I [Clostridia bacterium]
SGSHTTILYTKKGITDTVRVTPDYIRETYGVAPVQMIDVKGLMGDASDNIPGVPGIGEKTALKLIAQYGSLERVLETADTEQKGKLRERLMTYADQARMSKRLATIVRDVPIEYELKPFQASALANAIPHLRELGMAQAMRRLNAYVQKNAPELPTEPQKVPEKRVAVQRVDSLEELRRICDSLAGSARAIAFSIDADFTVAIDDSLFAFPMGGDLLSPGAMPEEALSAIDALLTSGCDKALWNLKALPVDPERIQGTIMDVMLAAYALNPQRPSFAADALCDEAGIRGYDQHPASAIMALARLQREQLRADGLEEIYSKVELPLACVLRDMEKTGFLVDAHALTELGETFKENIGALVEEIAEMAGERINLNSPKQLSELLFDKMGLPKPKKTSLGWSTSAEVLENLAQKYPICEKILEYRKYQKLESTYISSLTEMRDAQGRIHTRFDQVATATGRISSSEPNLQNIPVRTPLGKQIRKAFVAAPGCVLVDADYSQIELRVLAHMSGDETMIEAFNEGQDIHARTASEVYGVPLDEVTSAMRSSCKAVNFGIVYGISDFTLAKNIQASRQEAREFIDRYFERYPGVKRYMDNAVREGKEQGYVTTQMGRRRYLPELKSSSYNLRAFGERCAMNSPIQGTAADIIKLAMIRVQRALREEKLSAKLLLQVHDELIIEAPQEERDAVIRLLRECMEHIVTLKVPLRVEVSTGGDWCACK